MGKKWHRQGFSGDFHKWEVEGDALEGVVEAIREGKFGDVCDLRTAEGRKVTFPVQTGLALLFEGSGIKVGDEIRVVYIGYRKNEKTGRDFKDFELYVARDEDESGEPVDVVEGGPDDDIPFS